MNAFIPNPQKKKQKILKIYFDNEKNCSKKRIALSETELIQKLPLYVSLKINFFDSAFFLTKRTNT